VLSCVVVVAMIVIPNFLRSGKIPRYREAQSNLKAAFVAEKAHFAEKQTFDVAIDRVGFAPERGNRYLYAFSSQGALLEQGQTVSGHVGVKADNARYPDVDNAKLEAGIPDAIWDEIGITGTCPECSITIVAAGNIDDDETIDVWSISTKDRTIDGMHVSPGMPWHHVDDTVK
jgi:type IV pilus assembly protein PilA